MSENFIQPPANTGSGLKVRTFELNAASGPASGTAVEQEGTVLCDPTVNGNQLGIGPASLGSEAYTSSGGRATFAVTQANVQAGPQVVKGTPGRLCRVLVTTTTGGAALLITDGVGGTVIGVIPSGTTAGTVVSFEMPAATSINIPQAGAWTGAVTVSYY